jgi:hypothetical protein
MGITVALGRAWGPTPSSGRFTRFRCELGRL